MDLSLIHEIDHNHPHINSQVCVTYLEHPLGYKLLDIDESFM